VARSLRRILFSLVAGFGVVCPADPISFTEDDARTAHTVATSFVKNCTPRHAGTIRGRLAANWLLDRASWTGADVLLDEFSDTTPDGSRTFVNVMVELPGENSKAPWIVLMSHYDTAPTAPAGFEGANDGASTSGLLVALLGAARRAGKMRDNIAFVWTDGEECRKAYGPHDGFHGSRRLVSLFRERGRAVKTAICLDMLGDRDLRIVLPEDCTPQLKKLVRIAARRIGREALIAPTDGPRVFDDHSAFLEAGCPALDLIDFEFGSAPGLNDYWHTSQDTLDKISPKSLLAAGQLVAELLNLLERNYTK